MILFPFLDESKAVENIRICFSTPKLKLAFAMILIFNAVHCSSSKKCLRTKTTTHRHHMPPKQADSNQINRHTMPHRFTEAEKWAEKFDDPKRDQWQNPIEVVKHLDIDPGMTVADIGAGTGYFIRYLSNAAGPEGFVFCLDVEQSMVNFMSKRIKKSKIKNAQSKLVKLEDPQLADQSIDRILIVNTWHHILNRKAYIKRLYKALKPGGSITIVDFTKESPIGPPLHHRLNSSTIRREFSDTFWTTIEIDETLPYQFIVKSEKLAPQ